MNIFIILMLLGIVPLGWAEEPPFVYQDHGKRDPFWKLVTPSGAVMNYDTDISISDMLLEGIIAGPEGSNLAIVNNTIVKPNDRIGPFIIEKIENDKVFLRNGDENFVLKLQKEE